MELQVLQRFHSACFSTDAFYNKCSLMGKKSPAAFKGSQIGRNKLLMYNIVKAFYYSDMRKTQHRFMGILMVFKQ